MHGRVDIGHMIILETISPTESWTYDYLRDDKSNRELEHHEDKREDLPTSGICPSSSHRSYWLLCFKIFVFRDGSAFFHAAMTVTFSCCGTGALNIALRKALAK